MMRTHLNSPTPVLRDYSRSVVSRDWLPLAALGALYLIACGVAPAYELLAGIAR
ncbi:putative bacteriophage protein [Burkholderia multivorans ATCC 17616]|uniref:Bacteriophage protein n=2 Tax=Burkholderia multivorans TaxID=87883 RepID=A0A0H3KEL3_BURM1|nr:putative bacteriophage protein [Burkholderia multivorans ATCC 17616]